MSSKKAAPKKAAPKKVAPRKPVPKKVAPKKAAPKVAPKKAAARKPVLSSGKVLKKPAKPVKKAVARVVRIAAKPPAKVAPKAQKKQSKPVPPPPKGKAPLAKPTVKAELKPSRPVAPVHRGAPKRPDAPVVASVPVRPAAAAPARAGKKPRKVSRPGEPLATWIPQAPENRPRPASFIPAPPRAESPSTVAAPPASSDRLFRADDLSSASIALRTFPIRIDIEQTAGRGMVSTSPSEIVIRTGDALEWDVRYLGGMDVIVERVMIEFHAPSPFSSATFKSSKPGSARPHRQLSGAALANRVGTHTYTIRCFNAFNTEVAVGKSVVTISS